MRIWVRYRREDSAMRSAYAGIRARAHELGGLECRLWSPVRAEFLIEGGWPPEAMILIGRSDKAITDQKRLRIPAVYLDCSSAHERPATAPRKWTTLGVDDRAIGTLAARHLHGTGLRRFVLVTQAWRGVQGTRAAGFVETIKQLGGAVLDACGKTGHVPFDEADGPGPKRVVEFLGQIARPFGVYCASDLLAELAVDWCRAAHVAVPDDASVLGTGDDFLYAPHASVPLSSVHLPYYELGQRAVDHLVHILHDAGHPTGPRALQLMRQAAKRWPPGPLPPLGVTVRSSTRLAHSSDPLLKRLIAMVHAEATEGLTVDALAERLRLSTPTLLRRCKDTWDCTPSQLLQRARVQHAMRLLRDTTTNLADIAQHAGFADQATFTRAFRRVTGVTPGLYRTG